MTRRKPITSDALPGGELAHFADLHPTASQSADIGVQVSGCQKIEPFPVVKKGQPWKIENNH
ncbi:MAG: hypothetical protein SVY10_18490 [Thermodesulfobacteriota bacterium]|nr:hypothetical protein [Thermodesulfobacteriota bacterium]